MIEPKDQEAMRAYYNKRPGVGDAWGPAIAFGEVPDGPEQAELAARETSQFAADLAGAVSGRDVLELACGSGSSTAIAAKTANSVFATELATEPLKLAKARGLSAAKVRFAQSDAFTMLSAPGKYNALIATGFFDHIPKARFSSFLASVENLLGSGGVVFLSGSQWSTRAKALKVIPEGSEDSYMRRSMRDGTEYLILDNEFSPEDLDRIFANRGDKFCIHYGLFLWWITYTVR